MTMLISMVFMVSSCSDDDTDGGGILWQGDGRCHWRFIFSLEGVTVQVDGSGITATPDGPRATTNSQGVYTLENISIGTHIITFTKADYQTVSVTVVAEKFNEEQVAEVSPKMEYAAAKSKEKWPMQERVVLRWKEWQSASAPRRLPPPEATVRLKSATCHWPTIPLPSRKRVMLLSWRKWLWPTLRMALLLQTCAWGERKLARTDHRRLESCRKMVL